MLTLGQQLAKAEPTENVYSQAQFQNRENLEIQGHRGARAVLPENSQAGFLYALMIGVDTIELDMGVTSDGVVVVLHDQVINTVLCEHVGGAPLEPNVLVHQINLEFIKSIDCGNKPHPDFPLQRRVPATSIPTLDEVFTLIAAQPIPQAKTVLFNIETKSNPEKPEAQPAPEEFIRLVLDVVRKHQLENRVTIQSFDHRTLVEAYKQAPEVQRAALFREKPNDWLAAARAAHAHIVSPMLALIDQDDVAVIQAEGLRVIPWTANIPAYWEHLIKLGVDGIITDDPIALMAYVGRSPIIDVDAQQISERVIPSPLK